MNTKDKEKCKFKIYSIYRRYVLHDGVEWYKLAHVCVCLYHSTPLYVCNLFFFLLRVFRKKWRCCLSATKELVVTTWKCTRVSFAIFWLREIQFGNPECFGRTCEDDETHWTLRPTSSPDTLLVQFEAEIMASESSFKPTWPYLIIEVLATRAKFLNHLVTLSWSTAPSLFAKQKFLVVSMFASIAIWPSSIF